MEGGMYGEQGQGWEEHQEASVQEFEGEEAGQEGEEAGLSDKEDVRYRVGDSQCCAVDAVGPSPGWPRDRG